MGWVFCLHEAPTVLPCSLRCSARSVSMQWGPLGALHQPRVPHTCPHRPLHWPLRQPHIFTYVALDWGWLGVRVCACVCVHG